MPLAKVLIILSPYESSWRQPRREAVVLEAFAEFASADCVELADDTGRFQVFDRKGNLLTSDVTGCSPNHKRTRTEVVATIRRDCRVLA